MKFYTREYIVHRYRARPGIGRMVALSLSREGYVRAFLGPSVYVYGYGNSYVQCYYSRICRSSIDALKRYYKVSKGFRTLCDKIITRGYFQLNRTFEYQQIHVTNIKIIIKMQRFNKLV